MTRVEIKIELDKLLATFNPQDCGVTSFQLNKDEYDLIVNSVWQLKSGVKEEDMIKPEQLLDKIHNKDIRDTCIAKLLRGLFNKCGLHNYYYSNQKH